jgi:endonuclease YncB( thermonuclease family)
MYMPDSRISPIRRVLFLLLLLPTSLFGEPLILKGRAQVVDGDTFLLDGKTIRLEGIDAFEKDQACKTLKGEIWGCGRETLNKLKTLIEGKFTICYSNGKDGARFLATCEVESQNINRWLVSQGLAVAYRKYSTSYIPEEHLARETRKGGWSGTFRAPWEWRQKNKS